MREEGKGISYISLHVHVRTCLVSSVVERSVYSVECRGFESHPRQKSDCLGCAVLLCLVVCLTLLCFFLPFF